MQDQGSIGAELLLQVLDLSDEKMAIELVWVQLSQIKQESLKKLSGILFKFSTLSTKTIL